MEKGTVAAVRRVDYYSVSFFRLAGRRLFWGAWRVCEWVTVAEAKDLPPGDSMSVEHEGDSIALFNVDGTFYAIGNRCPHAAGPLAQGFIEKGRVTCPWHGWSFPLSLEDAPDDGLCRYALRVEDGAIQVEVPAKERKAG